MGPAGWYDVNPALQLGSTVIGEGEAISFVKPQDQKQLQVGPQLYRTLYN